jgi:hypothetical protein
MPAAGEAAKERNPVASTFQREILAETEEGRTALRKIDAAEVVRVAGRGRAVMRSGGYSGFGSIYLRYTSSGRYGFTVDIRISNHAQVDGGGWNSTTGERRGEADISYMIESENAPLPTVQAVRAAIAESIRRQIAG